MHNISLTNFNKTLSHTFIKYIETTNNVCMYKLGSSNPISSNVIFPNAKTLTLINCHKYGISNILHPSIFPNLERVNYLSAHPGDYNIHTRFSNMLEWTFPDRYYSFYNYMVEKGYGKKDKNLIMKYILNKKILDANNDVNKSFEFDLYIENYGITNGEVWSSQLREYFIYKYIHNIFGDNTFPHKLYIDYSNIDDEEYRIHRPVVPLHEAEILHLERERLRIELEEIYCDEIFKSTSV